MDEQVEQEGHVGFSADCLERSKGKYLERLYHVRTELRELVEGVECLEDAWGYPEALRALVVGSVVVIVDDTSDHKLYARVKGESSGHGNYFAWCFLRTWRT